MPLGAIVSDAAERQGIKIERGKRLQNIELTNSDGVIATFDDGSAASGDLLIGCDGVHSPTRQFIDPVAYEQLRRERTAKMFEQGPRSDSGKFMTTPIQRWFRDLTTPIFLELFANPKASDRIYSYQVAWDAPVTMPSVKS